MNHPLPARPNFIPSSNAHAGPSKPSPLNPSFTTSTPTPTKPLVTPIDPNKCSICSQPPKYTCPRCSFKTCSLECSKLHKSQQNCSGIRDPTSFIPLNQYGQGVWSDDYKWLEEGRRKVTGWGDGLKIEEIDNSSRSRLNNGKDGKERGGRDRGKNGNLTRNKKNTKADGLKRELAKRNCTIEFMPLGMEKKKVNQSSWNPKKHQLHITIQILVPFTLIGQLSSKDPLKTITHSRVLFSSPDTSSLPTLASLISAPFDFDNIVFILPFHSTPSRPAADHSKGQRLFYPPLNPSKSLAEVLSGTAWVEYPTVEVMEKSKWEEGLKTEKFLVVPLSEPLVRIRDSGWGKRKIDSVDQEDGDNVEGQEDDPEKVKIGGEGLVGLGDYESEEEEDEEEEEEGALSEDEGVDAVIADDVDQVEEVEPSIEVLQAVGMALAADLGEA